MSIRDRGRIKWVSLMLPEHRKKLQQLEEEEEQTTQPAVDEQQLEELNRVLEISCKKNKRIAVTYYNGKKNCRMKGRIKEVIPSQKKMILEGDISLSFDAVVDMELLE